MTAAYTGSTAVALSRLESGERHPSPSYCDVDCAVHVAATVQLSSRQCRSAARHSHTQRHLLIPSSSQATLPSSRIAPPPLGAALTTSWHLRPPRAFSQLSPACSRLLSSTALLLRRSQPAPFSSLPRVGAACERCRRWCAAMFGSRVLLGATKLSSITSKRGNKNFYKGRGAKSIGYRTPRGPHHTTPSSCTEPHTACHHLRDNLARPLIPPLTLCAAAAAAAAAAGRFVFDPAKFARLSFIAPDLAGFPVSAAQPHHTTHSTRDSLPARSARHEAEGRGDSSLLPLFSLSAVPPAAEGVRGAQHASARP